MKMQIEIEKIARSPSRTGRDLQRYNLDRRQVVGCIPYRFQENNCSPSVVDKLEVLLISSQKSEKMMFPKGGWESDESMEQAVLREALEEAGITGSIESNLGKWTYKSKSQDKMHDGYMFALLVNQQFDDWPERDVRRRKWVKVEEARELCPYQWMKEALDSLIERLEGRESGREKSPAPSEILLEDETSSSEISSEEEASPSEMWLEDEASSSSWSLEEASSPPPSPSPSTSPSPSWRCQEAQPSSSSSPSLSYCGLVAQFKAVERATDRTISAHTPLGVVEYHANHGNHPIRV